jgi:hypothetical protein
MRSITYVQPGQTVGCIGCHESRHETTPSKQTIASRREPSKIIPGPSGSWPYRFDKLVQPVLDKQCVSCHRPGGKEPKAGRINLTPEKSYETLVNYGKPSLTDQVKEGYGRGYSIAGKGFAQNSAVLGLLTSGKTHNNVKLTPDDLQRMILWLDCYGQKLGAFSDNQERELEELRNSWAGMLAEK